MGLLAGLRLPRAVRWSGLLAYALVVLHLMLIHNPWDTQIGRWVQLQGEVRQGFLHTPQGALYVRHFPPLADGQYSLEGRLRGFDEATWLKGLGITAMLEAKSFEHFRPQGGIRS